MTLTAYRQQAFNAAKKFFKGWKGRREILDKRNENFELHLRRRRFISKILCEGLVGGGCNGKDQKALYSGFVYMSKLRKFDSKKRE